MDLFPFLIKLTSKVLTKYRSEHAARWIEFENEFERKKCEYRQTGDVMLSFPDQLKADFSALTKGDLSSVLEEKEWSEKLELKVDFLVIKSNMMKNLFYTVTDEIIRHIRDELLKKNELKEVKTLLLVGGFSESPVVGEAVRKAFSELRVIVPPSAKISVLKGAVMFGSDPNIIAMRISPFTYGVHTRVLYNPERHSAIKPVMLKDRKVVENAFHRHLTKGEQVYIGENKRKSRYKCVNPAKEIFWKVYQSTEEDPILCNPDYKCKQIGKLEINLPENIREKQVSLVVTMTCIGSELESEVYADLPKRNIQCKSKFDFLDTDLSGCEFESSLVE